MVETFYLTLLKEWVKTYSTGDVLNFNRVEEKEENFMMGNFKSVDVDFWWILVVVVKWLGSVGRNIKGHIKAHFNLI